ncbi:hypothetical protein CDAR_50531 [Caerostris darwini]|uniref:Uncharacterized protein n=1 Tax=Caerostris darwini TaxID=1538125 RepID=A0AAV4UXE5_9ARAC|nr:hypothetical protein CDAR_50531 [Caerostris darwini]
MSADSYHIGSNKDDMKCQYHIAVCILWRVTSFSSQFPTYQKMFAKVVIFCVALAAAHASLVGPMGLGAPLMAAGPLGIGIGKGMIAAPVARIAAPIGLVGNGLIGNGMLANGVIGNGMLANGVIAGNGILANRLVGGHGIAGAPLAIGTGLLGAPIGLGLGLGKAIL